MPRTPRRLVLVLLAVALAGLAPAPAPLQPLDFDRGASGLGLALRRVGASGRVLYVTAHPDDEHNGLLVRLSRGLGIRTALFSLTRGEGGQNAIGPELFEALGVLRTDELQALHDYDAVEQYFGRAYEFGYSFSVEETFAKWGHDETLGDVVRAVRAFRPDVILTLPLQGGGGGQHHQAAGRLAAEAFRAAADPNRFPEQLREPGLRPWQARRLYVVGVGGVDQGLPAGPQLRLPTGVFDPLLGMTWQQIGSRARASHRSQMMSQRVADPGPAEASFTLLDAEPAGEAPQADLLDPVESSLEGLSRFAPELSGELSSLQQLARAARASFDPASLEASLPPLAAEHAAVTAVEHSLERVGDESARAELRERLEEERLDVERALWKAQGLSAEALASDGVVTPGQSLEVRLSLWNNGRAPAELAAAQVEADPGWSATARDGSPGALPGGGSRVLRFALVLPADARPSQPYWHRMSDRDRNAVEPGVDPLLPFAPPAARVRLRLRVAGVLLESVLPVIWRSDDPIAGGEKRHELQVTPGVAVRVVPEMAVLPLAGVRRSLELHVYARNEQPGAVNAELRLEAPPGWTVHPARAALRFGYEGEELGARFEVRPPAAVAAGLASIRAVVASGGREDRDTVQVIDYPHVERRQLLRPAQSRVLCLELRANPRARVGYVMGSGDALAEAIRQLGVPLTLLGSDDLVFGDLERFSTIVTGIRAYDTRSDLRAAHARLMRWVEAGGHLVVQYNRAPFNRLAPQATAETEGASPFTPYPARVTSERISDETAPIRVLAPAHPLLRTPNAIGARDWDGWVQERGIQFLKAEDPRYQELLGASDPFPFNAGEKRGLLVDAAVGRGSWTYVGLALFRQVPAGVPGGWRLLANLVSRPAPQRTVAHGKEASSGARTTR